MIEPISPQGVVGLERESFTHKQGEQITGQSILEEFTIVNPQINDRSVLEKYISDTGVVKIPKTEMIDTSMAKTSNTPKVIAASLVILVLVVSGLWFAVKHLKKY